MPMAVEVEVEVEVGVELEVELELELEGCGGGCGGGGGGGGDDSGSAQTLSSKSARVGQAHRSRYQFSPSMTKVSQPLFRAWQPPSPSVIA